MEQAGRFLWLPWLRSQVRGRRKAEANLMTYWEGEHDGYQRLSAPVTHRRGLLRLEENWWLVLDRLTSDREHLYRLHWLLADVPYTWNEVEHSLKLETDAGECFMHLAASKSTASSSLVRADESTARGWQSLYYNNRQPALSVDLSTEASSTTFCTLFAPEPCGLSLSGDELSVITDRKQARIRLQKQKENGQLMIHSVLLDGSVKEHWEV
jgi:hypothetical protein